MKTDGMASMAVTVKLRRTDSPGWKIAAGRQERYARIGRFVRHRPALVAAIVLALYLIGAAFAPVLAHYDPLDMSAGSRLVPPNRVNWLGTDEFGRDIFSRILFGARIAFTVGISSSLIAMVAGSAMGTIGAYVGGLLDRAVTAIIDLLYAFPAVLLAIALAVFMNPSVRTVIVAIAIVQMPHFARVSRGAVLAIKGEPYVESALAVGADHSRVLLRHVLPNISSPLIVQTALSFSYAVLSESLLSFLGVGNPPPAPDWGAMLTGSYGYIEQAPWAPFFPGMALTVLILGSNLLSDGLQELLDPTRRRG